MEGVEFHFPSSVRLFLFLWYVDVECNCVSKIVVLLWRLGVTSLL